MKLNQDIEVLAHQGEDSDFALSAHYSINASEMGTGKTLTAILTIMKAGGKALVVVPPYLATQWKEEIQKFTDATICLLYKKNAKYKGEEICLTTYTKIDSFDELWPMFDIVVADESHYLKNPRAIRTEKFISRIEQHRPNRLLLLTGTPIKNRIPEYFTTLLLFSYGPTTKNKVTTRFPSYYTFCHYFSNPRVVKVKNFHITQFSGMKNTDELKAMIKPHYVRRKSDEVLQLPGCIYKEVIVDYKENPGLLTAWEAFTNARSAIDISAKAASAMLKAPFTAEYVRALLDEERPVIVLSDHQAPVEYLALQLSDFRCAYIHGGVDQKKRDDIIQKFRNGQLDVLIGTTETLGTGYNLTVSRHMVFNDESWVPGTNSQARKRIDRLGQTRKVMYHYILGSKVDKYIHRSLRAKEKIINEVT